MFRIPAEYLSVVAHAYEARAGGYIDRNDNKNWKKKRRERKREKEREAMVGSRVTAVCRLPIG